MIFRTITLWLFGLPITGFLFIFVLLSIPFDRQGRAIHSIGSLWCRIILFISGIKVNITGLSNLPKSGPVIIASNHQGIFDIPVLQGLLPLQFRWVSKQSLFKIPVIGWTMSFAGYISIDRASATKSLRSLKRAAERIKSGTSVLLFPEGTRGPDRTLLPFKRGLFFMGTKSGVPLVPISISGTSNIMKDHSVWIKPTIVEVTIHEPIDTNGIDEKELMELTRKAIESGLGW
ncbi:MAG: 1-acyl-sn-glycerol-3-phosphate acyltransferase [Proteobacteria bacterium]|nr:1-acyl-sn-glycerol-3-phosphate acyltransferase [Pseudomonadota bacterium]